MTVDEFLLEVGVKAPNIVAGAAGGLVRAIMLKRTGEPWHVGDLPNVITSALVGMLTAAYLAEPIAKLVGVSSGPAGFLVGLAGMALCQRAVEEVIKRWRVGPPSM